MIQVKFTSYIHSRDGLIDNKIIDTPIELNTYLTSSYEEPLPQYLNLCPCVHVSLPICPPKLPPCNSLIICSLNKLLGMHN